MGAWLGVPAPTEDDNEPKSRRKKRTGAGKETSKKQSSARSEVLGVSQMTGPELPAAANESHIPQHGFEDDRQLWKKWVPPPRVKASKLTPEETAKFKQILNEIFSEETTVRGQLIVFDPRDVMEVMQKVVPYLESEPMLIEDVPFDVTIVGDIRGQLHDLNRVFNAFAKDGKPGWECRKFLFLGNYVDGGRASLEVIMALFCLKMLYPDDIFLLRGNHEFLNLEKLRNFDNDLFYDILERYDVEDAKAIFCRIHETFCWLSAAAIVGGIYFCAHGGLSPACPTRFHMRNIRKPLIRLEDDARLVDVICAEPETGLRGAAFNGKTGSCYSGFDAVAVAMGSMEVKAVFRGHTTMTEGYGSAWGVVYTVFTATDHERMGNKGAVAVIDARGKLSLKTFPVDPNRRAWEAALRKASGNYEDGDPKTICEEGPGAGAGTKPGAGKSRASKKSAKRTGKSGKSKKAKKIRL